MSYDRTHPLPEKAGSRFPGAAAAGTASTSETTKSDAALRTNVRYPRWRGPSQRGHRSRPWPCSAVVAASTFAAVTTVVVTGGRARAVVVRCRADGRAHLVGRRTESARRGDGAA